MLPKRLLKSGYDFVYKNIFTPLYAACLLQKNKMLESLLSAGANPFKKVRGSSITINMALHNVGALDLII